MTTIDPENKISNNYEETTVDFNDEYIEPIIYYRNPKILVLDNVLNDTECDNIKTLIDNIDNINKRTKLCLKFSQLSNIINSRCNKYIPSSVFIHDEYLDEKYGHNNNNEYWCKEEININWRLVKCELNSQLSMHYDGVYVKSVDNKSIYTVMLYLENSDGDLKFHNIQIKPKKGRLVIFNQELLHEGLINKNHVKYFIRSEIMYTRLNPIESDNDKVAINLYNQAREIFKEDKEKAIELETDAFLLSPLLERLILNI